MLAEGNKKIDGYYNQNKDWSTKYIRISLSENDKTNLFGGATQVYL